MEGERGIEMGTYPGMEKSFISLFIMTPVSGIMTREPKSVLMVVVRLIAIPLLSATTT
jgi:hypothetical protein